MAKYSIPDLTSEELSLLGSGAYTEEEILRRREQAAQRRAAREQEAKAYTPPPVEEAPLQEAHSSSLWSKTADVVGGAVSELWPGIKSGYRGLLGGMAQGLADDPSQVIPSIMPPGTAALNRMFGGQSLEERAAESIGLSDYLTKSSRQLNESNAALNTQETQDIPQIPAGELGNVFDENPEGVGKYYGRQLGHSLGFMGPAIAAGVASRGKLVAPMVTMGLMTKASDYGEFRGKGASEEQASLASTGTGVLEGVLGAIPIGIATKPGTGLFKRAIGAALGEEITEIPTTIGQMATEEAAGITNYTTEDYIQGIRDTALIAGLPGAAGAAVAHPFSRKPATPPAPAPFIAGQEMSDELERLVKEAKSKTPDMSKDIDMANSFVSLNLDDITKMPQFTMDLKGHKFQDNNMVQPIPTEVQATPQNRVDELQRQAKEEQLRNLGMPRLPDSVWEGGRQTEPVMPGPFQTQNAPLIPLPETPSNNVAADLSKLSTVTLQILGEMGAGSSRSINQLPPADVAILEAAGLVEDHENDDGTISRVVYPDAVAQERNRRAALPREATSQEDINRAVENRARNYERIADEKEEAGYPEEAAELRAKAAAIRSKIQPVNANVAAVKPQGSVATLLPDPLTGQAPAIPEVTFNNEFRPPSQLQGREVLGLRNYNEKTGTGTGPIGPANAPTEAPVQPEGMPEVPSQYQQSYTLPPFKQGYDLKLGKQTKQAETKASPAAEIKSLLDQLNRKPKLASSADTDMAILERQEDTDRFEQVIRKGNIQDAHTLADTLKGMLKSDRAKSMVNAFLSAGFLKNVQVRIADTEADLAMLETDNARALYQPAKDGAPAFILLAPSKAGPTRHGMSPDLVYHEIGHAVTYEMVEAARTGVETTPEIQSLYEQLDMLRQDVAANIDKMATNEAERQAIQNATSDVHEMISYTLTNQNFNKAASRFRVKGITVRQWIKNILSKLATKFGVSVKDANNMMDVLFDRALTAVQETAKYDPAKFEMRGKVDKETGTVDKRLVNKETGKPLASEITTNPPVLYSQLEKLVNSKMSPKNATWRKWQEWLKSMQENGHLKQEELDAFYAYGDDHLYVPSDQIVSRDEVTEMVNRFNKRAFRMMQRGDTTIEDAPIDVDEVAERRNRLQPDTTEVAEAEEITMESESQPSPDSAYDSKLKLYGNKASAGNVPVSQVASKLDKGNVRPIDIGVMDELLRSGSSAEVPLFDQETGREIGATTTGEGETVQGLMGVEAREAANDSAEGPKPAAVKRPFESLPPDRSPAGWFVNVMRGLFKPTAIEGKTMGKETMVLVEAMNEYKGQQFYRAQQALNVLADSPDQKNMLLALEGDEAALKKLSADDAQAVSTIVNTIDMLQRAGVVHELASLKNPTEKDIAVAKKVVASILGDEKYRHRAYAKDIQKRGISTKWVADLLRNKDEKGSLWQNAKAHLIANELTIPSDFKSMGLPTLERMYAHWTGLNPEGKSKSEIIASLEKFRNKSGPEIDAKAEELVKMLLDLTPTPGPGISRLYAGNKQDLTIVTPRSKIDEPIRKLWGEVEDPLAKIVVTVTKLIEFNARHRFLMNLYETGVKDGWIAEADDPKADPSLSVTLEGREFGPLDGMRVTPNVKSILDSVLKLEKDMEFGMQNNVFQGLGKKVGKKAVRFWERGLISPIKALMLTTNPKVWITNLLSGPGVLMANGNFTGAGGLTVIKNAWGLANITKHKKWNPFTDKVISQGWMDSALFGELTNEQLSDYASAVADSVFTEDTRRNKFRKLSIAAKDKATGSKDVFRNMFALMDMGYKLMNGVNEANRLRAIHPDWSDEKVMAVASDRVKMTNYTRGRAIPVAKWADKKGLQFFATYMSEIGRTLGYNTMIGVSDVIAGSRDGNPKQIAHGMSRVIGVGLATMYYDQLLSFAVSGAGMLMGSALSILGEDDDEDRNEKARDIIGALPEDWRNQLLVPIAVTKDGKLQMQAADRFDFHGQWNSIFRAAAKVANGKEDWKFLANEVQNLFFMHSLVRNMLNPNPGRLQKIAPEAYETAYKFLTQTLPLSDSTANRIINTAMTADVPVIRTGLLPTINNMGKPASERQDVNWLGFNPIEYDPKLELVRGADRYNGSLSANRNELAKLIANTGMALDKPGLEKFYNSALDEEISAFSELNAKVKGARAMGYNNSQIASILASQNVRRDYIPYVMHGKFVPRPFGDRYLQSAFIDTQFSDATPERKKALSNRLIQARAYLDQLRMEYMQNDRLN